MTLSAPQYEKLILDFLSESDESISSSSSSGIGAIIGLDESGTVAGAPVALTREREILQKSFTFSAKQALTKGSQHSLFHRYNPNTFIVTRTRAHITGHSPSLNLDESV